MSFCDDANYLALGVLSTKSIQILLYSTMTNSTGDSRFLVLGQTYLYWLEKEVFPYLFGSICIVELIVGVVLNICLAILYKKNKNDDTFVTNIYFIITDLVASIFILLPGVGISFSKAESIPDALCSILGIINNTVFIFQFGIICLIFISISLSLHYRAENLFPRPFVVVLASVILLSVSFLIAVLPVAFDGYELQTSEYRCVIDTSNIKVVTIISLVPFFGSLIGGIAASCFLIKHVLNKSEDTEHESKSNEDTHELGEQNSKLDKHEEPLVKDEDLSGELESDLNSEHDNDKHQDNHGEVDTTDDNLPTDRQTTMITVAESEGADSVQPELTMNTGGESETESDTRSTTTEDQTRESAMPSQTSPSFTPTSTSFSRSDVTEMHRPFDSIAEKYAVVSDLLSGKTPCKLYIKNVLLYLAVWLMMFICWCPYVVLAFVRLYGSLWWDGWMTVAVCVGYISYCIKHVVILTVRKDLREKSAQLLPKNVGQKAKQIELKLNAVF